MRTRKSLSGCACYQLMGGILPLFYVQRGSVIALVLLLCVPAPRALADEPTCSLKMAGGVTGFTNAFHDGPDIRVVVAKGGLFRYDGKAVVHVPGADLPFYGLKPWAPVYAFHDGPNGLLAGSITRYGLFRYDGTELVRVPGSAELGNVRAFHDRPSGVLVGALNGLFLYDGRAAISLTGDAVKLITAFHDGPRGLLFVSNGGLNLFDGKAVVSVPGGAQIRNSVFNAPLFFDQPDGVLVGSYNGLFLYDGKAVVPVPGDETGAIKSLHELPDGVLVGALNGLFRYNGKGIARVPGDETGDIRSLHELPDGVLLVGAENGLFRYDGRAVVHVSGDETGDIRSLYELPDGALVGALNGLFRYNGAVVVRMADYEMGSISAFHNGPDGVLVGAANGLFRVSFEPLSNSQVVLSNWSELNGATVGSLGVPTRWRMTHSCSILADHLGLQVIPTSPSGKDGNPVQVKHIEHERDTASFEVVVPITEPGNWTFRVMSNETGANIAVGKSSNPITFVTPRGAELNAWYVGAALSFVAATIAILLFLYRPSRKPFTFPTTVDLFRKDASSLSPEQHVLPNTKRFSIALSFPGEYRAFVLDVASCLARHVGRDRVLYDGFYEAEFARFDLDTYLQRLYHDESELIAVFLCAEYEHKEWCGLEWRAIRNLIKLRKRESIMLLRFDKTEIPGLFSIDGCVWIDDRKPEVIANLILKKFSLMNRGPS
jgi:hypothetical protein